MTTPRSLLVDQQAPLHYHLVSRCVRQSWLCGNAPGKKKNYDYRKNWLVKRLFHLARCFAVEIDAYAILSNHFHIVLYYDPLANQQWSNEEVAYRWVEAFPPVDKGEVIEELKTLRREQLLANQTLLSDRRRKLGCLSTFMKHLKQPIARRANKEDGCQGHFFEKRFYSGALLSEQAVLASMAYVDLNPVRAKIAKRINQCRNTSIVERLKHVENSLKRLNEVLEPLASGINEKTQRFEITLKGYINALNEVINGGLDQSLNHQPSKQSRWFAQVASMRRRQRAYGPIALLSQWAKHRGLKNPGCCLPD